MNTTEEFEGDIEFFDKEAEKQEIMNILRIEPQLINFIYGPINSGKTTLITDLIEELPENYVVFYVNLRRKSVIKYEDFIRVLFSVEKNKEIKDIITGLLAKAEKAIYASQGIPVNDSLLDTFLKKDSKADVLEFLENYFKEISKTKDPVLIIDELQVIGDLEIDGKLIYRLFNFFIGLTKELHLCHVFALSSDSLFIEKAYNEAMLEGRANYILVDDFDEKTAKKFLERYRIKGEEIKYILDHVGGKPIDLVELIYPEDKKKEIEQRISLRSGQIERALKRVKELGEKIIMDDVKHDVSYENLLKTLSKFKDGEEIKCNEIDEISESFFAKKNVLFVDPVRKMIKPQSGINLLAIREVLKEIRDV